MAKKKSKKNQPAPPATLAKDHAKQALDAPTHSEQESTPAPERQSPGAGFPIVGIGASAGGLEAALNLFQVMPPDSGMAFALIQHLDPHKGSLTADLLAKKTSMPVAEATDGTPVRPNCVYVLPPNRYLSIAKGVLSLTQFEYPRAGRAEIDFFLRSLGEDQGERAIAAILSGTGSDGALGARAVKAAGGLTIAQDPATAQHEGMPRSAIATGMVDHVLPVEKMPAVLLRYARHPYVNHPTAEAKRDATQKPIDPNGILALIRARTKYDFRSYKKKTLIRRIGQELHDGLGQQISGLAMLATALTEKLKAEGSPYADHMAKLAGAIENAKLQYTGA